MILSIEDMATFCKKKGFVYQNSEIYGGMSGFWDFGHLGVELRNNIISHWWKYFVQSRDNIVGIDGAVITNPKVWEASGHVECFTDVLLKCTKCQHMVRGDILLSEELGMNEEGMTIEAINKAVKKNKLKCKQCGASFADGKQFNLMFSTVIGPIESKEHMSYLRPETAQLIFTNFKLVEEHSRQKLPFGIAQVGKAFRNEISPRDFLFRSREFGQMEIEFFTHPEKINDCPLLKSVEKMKVNIITAKDQEKKQTKHKEITIKDLKCTQWHAYWLAESYKWFLDLGIKKENLRFREHMKDELAHYAGACFDVEYKFPFGWKEIHGNADRKQFDLTQHGKATGKEITMFDEETKQKVTPYVASEPSQGIERALLAFLFDAYNDDKKRGNIVLKLHPYLAPVKVGVFPLVNKLNKEAKEVFNMLNKDFPCQFDRSGSVGRRYARADEIGTPYCVTFDFDSLKDKAVTIRDRNTTKQVRTKIKDLPMTLYQLLNSQIKFDKAGKAVKQ